jgi:hypothetical protein
VQQQQRQTSHVRAGYSTSGTVRLAMNLAVRPGSPVRLTSTTSTMPRPVETSPLLLEIDTTARG